MNDTSYNNFIYQFKIYPTYNSARHKGFEAHHIIPKALQKESEFDDRCVRLTSFEHVYAHYLLALENSEAAAIFAFMVNYNFSKLSELEKITLEQLKEWGRLREEGKLSGEKHPNYGKHHTKESKIRISEAQKGKPRGPHSEESKRKMSEAHKGKHYSEEYKRKMSESCKGLNTWSKGRHWYTNGAINVCETECPEGFYPGKVNHK